MTSCSWKNNGTGIIHCTSCQSSMDEQLWRAPGRQSEPEAQPAKQPSKQGIPRDSSQVWVRSGFLGKQVFLHCSRTELRIQRECQSAGPYASGAGLPRHWGRHFRQSGPEALATRLKTDITASGVEESVQVSSVFCTWTMSRILNNVSRQLCTERGCRIVKWVAAGFTMSYLW